MFNQEPIQMKMNFKTVSSLWIKDKRQYVRQSTAAAYSFILNRYLLPNFGDKESLTEEDAQLVVLNAFERGLSRNYIKGMINVLRMVLRYGTKIGFDADPQMELHLQKEVQSHRVMAFSAKDQNVLMNYLRANFVRKNIGIYMGLAFGLRIGEVCALKWQDMDFEHGLISIRSTVQRICLDDNAGRRTGIVVGLPKSLSSIREIPMTREFAQLLRPLVNNTEPDCYVLSGTTSPIEPRVYRNHYKTLLRTLGLPDVRFHGLRHSFATRCIDGRCDYKTVSSILGHTSINTTLNMYVHPNVDQKRECLEKMSGIFDGEYVSPNTPATPGSHPRGNGLPSFQMTVPDWP